MRRTRLEVAGIEYACLEVGEGPLLLFGHGTFGGKELFLPQLEELSDAFRCVAFDWPGHGESGFDPDGWSVGDLVTQLPFLIEGLGAESALVAGVSQGGAVFMRVALEHPECIDGMVNMCAGPGVPPPAAVARLRRLGDQLASGPNAERARAAAELAAGWHGEGFALRDRLAAEREIDVVLSHPREALRLLPEVPAGYESIEGRLGEIACPTLVIWGSADPRPWLGPQIAAAIDGAYAVTIEGGGHHVNVDAPAETSAAIRHFAQVPR